MAEAKADLQVELVAADRVVWSGRASMVLARTTEGDIGILRDHSPVLSVLVPGVIEIRPEDGNRVVAVVDGGFLSVAANRVSILAERTTLAGDVDVSAAQADLEAARLLTMQAAWLADNRTPNSLEASMAKAKAGRVGSDITLSCVELCASVGYSESELLEKWARDSKILDIFEGTQQIQQLIVARRVLGLSSAELK